MEAFKLTNALNEGKSNPADKPKSRELKVSRLLAVVIISAILIVLVLGGFYWFGLRPVSGRKSCDEVAKDKAGKIYRTSGLYSPKQKTEYDFAYKTCLHDKGF